VNTLQVIALIYVVGWIAFLPSTYAGDRDFGGPTRSRAQAILDAIWIAAFWPLSWLINAISLIVGRLEM